MRLFTGFTCHYFRFRRLFAVTWRGQHVPIVITRWFTFCCLWSVHCIVRRRPISARVIVGMWKWRGRNLKEEIKVKAFSCYMENAKLSLSTDISSALHTQGSRVEIINSSFSLNIQLTFIRFGGEINLTEDSERLSLSGSVAKCTHRKTELYTIWYDLLDFMNDLRRLIILVLLVIQSTEEAVSAQEWDLWPCEGRCPRCPPTADCSCCWACWSHCSWWEGGSCCC